MTRERAYKAYHTIAITMDETTNLRLWQHLKSAPRVDATQVGSKKTLLSTQLLNMVDHTSTPLSNVQLLSRRKSLLWAYLRRRQCGADFKCSKAEVRRLVHGNGDGKKLRLYEYEPTLLLFSKAEVRRLVHGRPHILTPPSTCLKIF